MTARRPRHPKGVAQTLGRAQEPHGPHRLALPSPHQRQFLETLDDAGFAERIGELL